MEAVPGSPSVVSPSNATLQTSNSMRLSTMQSPSSPFDESSDTSPGPTVNRGDGLSSGLHQRRRGSIEKAHSMRLVRFDSVTKGPGHKSESSTPTSVRRISTGLNENVADTPSSMGSVSDFNDRSLNDDSSDADDGTEYCIQQITLKEEGMLKVVRRLNRQEGCIRLEREMYKKYFSSLTQGFRKWTSFVRESNSVSMEDDKGRWHLHAICNQSYDLQAWYHGMFHQEVYRLRGPFWYKNAMLPVYNEAYDVIDTTLTPAEEEALAHVLCSPDTTYGDVSAHMFVIEAMLNDNNLYQLFLKLTSTGLQITKYPRSGRPARKTFRVSFVEGKIFFTWKGKCGNQGVDFSDVIELLPGIQTEILKKTAHSGRADQYLSLICTGRSVDLFFDDDDDRNSTLKLLEVLIRKEKNELIEFESVIPSMSDELVYWMNYKESFGDSSIPVHILRKIEERKLKDEVGDEVLKEINEQNLFAAKNLEDKLNRMMQASFSQESK